MYIKKNHTNRRICRIFGNRRALPFVQKLPFLFVYTFVNGASNHRGESMGENTNTPSAASPARHFDSSYSPFEADCCAATSPNFRKPRFSPLLPHRELIFLHHSPLFRSFHCGVLRSASFQPAKIRVVGGGSVFSTFTAR